MNQSAALLPCPPNLLCDTVDTRPLRDDELAAGVCEQVSGMKMSERRARPAERLRPESCREHTLTHTLTHTHCPPQDTAVLGAVTEVQVNHLGSPSAV